MPNNNVVDLNWTYEEINPNFVYNPIVEPPGGCVCIQPPPPCCCTPPYHCPGSTPIVEK